MSVTSTFRITDNTDALLDAIRAKSIRALEQATAAGVATFDRQAAGITTATNVAPRGTERGYSAGIRAKNALWRIFDKGSLGKRTARLKRNRRKEEWTVRRKGTEYTAHRRDTSGKGIAPRDISNPTRLAGKHALRDAFLR